MRRFMFFSIFALCVMMTCTTYGQFLPKQPTLDDEAAVQTTKGYFEQLWYWDTTTQTRNLKIIIPMNPLTPVLGQDKEIVRFVQAYKVGYDVDSKTMTSADAANGIQWKGTVTFTAERYRMFDDSTGWQNWIDNAQLHIFTIMKVQNSWRMTEEKIPFIAQGVKVQKPTSTELPMQHADPRPVPMQPQRSPCRSCERLTADGRCVQFRACYN